MKSPSSPDTGMPPPEPPACAPTLAWVQRLLDGENTPEPRDAAAHRAACPTCAARHAAALRLIEGLSKLTAPAVPMHLAGRILDRLAVEPTRRRGRTVRIIAACLALAASVFVAVLAVTHWPNRADTPVRVSSSFTAPKEPETAPPPRLSDALNEAGSAVAALTRKAAEETMSVKLPSLSLPPMPMGTGPLESFEPAVVSIQHVQHGAVLSVSPITNSAKRAADMFWRELGGGPDRPPAVD